MTDDMTFSEKASSLGDGYLFVHAKRERHIDRETYFSQRPRFLAPVSPPSLSRKKQQASCGGGGTITTPTSLNPCRATDTLWELFAYMPLTLQCGRRKPHSLYRAQIEIHLRRASAVSSLSRSLTSASPDLDRRDRAKLAPIPAPAHASRRPCTTNNKKQGPRCSTI